MLAQLEDNLIGWRDAIYILVIEFMPLLILIAALIVAALIASYAIDKRDPRAARTKQSRGFEVVRHDPTESHKADE